MEAERVSAVEVDAVDTDSIKKAVRGSPVLLNCIGPFYRYGPGVLRATINSHVNCVDICDDFDATEKMLATDKDAKTP